jgi:branched-chain amino acid transport system substrate-binding protein
MNVSRRRFLTISTVGLTAMGAGHGASADETQIVLGCSLPLSGPAAAQGITAQRTIEHVVEVINNDGIQIGPDRYTIHAAFYDNKYVPAEAVTVVEKMLADGVRYIYSSGSGNSVPVVEKTTAVKALQLSGASGKNHLTAPQFPYSFRTAPTNETAFAVYPWLQTAYPAIKKIAHMNPSDEAGFTESEDRRMLSTRNHYDIVANEYFKRGSTDFYPVATRLAGAEPDLIDFGGTIGRDQALATKALRELGYKGFILLGYADVRPFVEIAGKDAAEGTLMFDTLAAPFNDPQKAFWAWWTQKYGPPFPPYACTVYDAPLVMAEGMRRANSVDPVKVAATLRGMSWTGLYGDERFGMKSIYGIDTTMTRVIPMARITDGVPTQLAIIPWPKDV